ncbi:unnamed protein product [Moneuplotes crassus]|uniref:GAF domain-containing protein n=1 Tax=Euplotes crassus TaxID=5936 RepID=A0AAD1XNL9_EUPCR|nr:unnamed protein product [Moneuplotes crassus]
MNSYSNIPLKIRTISSIQLKTPQAALPKTGTQPVLKASDGHRPQRLGEGEELKEADFDSSGMIKVMKKGNRNSLQKTTEDIGNKRKLKRKSMFRVSMDDKDRQSGRLKSIMNKTHVNLSKILNSQSVNNYKQGRVQKIPKEIIRNLVSKRKKLGKSRAEMGNLQMKSTRRSVDTDLRGLDSLDFNIMKKIPLEIPSIVVNNYNSNFPTENLGFEDKVQKNETEELNKEIEKYKKREKRYINYTKVLEKEISRLTQNLSNNDKESLHHTIFQSIYTDDEGIPQLDKTHAMPSIQNMFQKDMVNSVIDLKQKIDILTSQNNKLEILLSKKRQECTQKDNVLRSYRRMITSLNSQLQGSGQFKRNSSQDCIQDKVKLEINSGTDHPKEAGFYFGEPVSNTTPKAVQELSIKNLYGIATQRNFVEIKRLKALEPFIKDLADCKTLYKMFKSSTSQVKKLINCKSCTVFIFDKKTVRFDQPPDSRLIKHKDYKISKENLNFVRLKIENDWIDCISENESEVSDPVFQKIEDIRYGVQTKESLVLPLFGSNKTIIAGIQLLYKAKRGFSGKETRTFNIDQIIFRMFTSLVQIKMNELFAERRYRFQTKHLYDTMSLSSKITTQKSYKSLIREVKNLLPPYFDFESVGVLLLDTKTKNLFTISEIQKEGEESDCDEYADSGDIISFPSNIGITGLIFNSEEVYISNDAQKDMKFTSDIDNLTSITEVFNFMIGPVYASQRNKPVGVIQLMNKKEKKPINEEDIDKFKIIQELLGRSISNTAQLHELINVTIGLKSNLGHLTRIASHPEL